MSHLDAFTKGWSFRTSTPDFEPGQEITAFVTGHDDGTHVVRIGDTVLSLDDIDDAENGDGDRSSDGNGTGGETNLLDSQVRLRVEEFNTNDHIGRATVLERLGESSF